MAEHSFQMRLECKYEDPDNSVTDIEVRSQEDGGEWKAFDLSFRTPGFLLFVYSIFNCQHMYMRLNAAERGLALASASGSIEVIADAGWRLQTLIVHFSARVRSGQAGPDDIDQIVDRMRHCPVSINLLEVADSQATLELT